MMTKEKTSTFDYEIKPSSGVLNFNFKELWHYRDLLALLVRRDFVSFYKQTIFGPLWFFIQPIFTTIIFVFVFSRMAGLSTNGVPPALFYLAGTVAWNYFADCLTKTSTVFRDNANIFGKVYFPRLIIPLSIIISNLLKFGVQFLLFILMMIWYLVQGEAFSPNGYVLLFPFILIMMALHGLGVGLIITALTTKYRDLAFLVAFGVQLVMYATPVIYPLSSVPEKFQKFLMLNPLSGLIETFRYGFLGKGVFYPSAFLFSVISTVVVVTLGLIVFNKVERNFVDTI